MENLGERSATAQIVIHDKTDIAAFGDGRLCTEPEIQATVSLEIAFPCLVVAACTPNSLEVGHVALGKELQGSHPIQQGTAPHHMLHFTFRKVFVEHRKIVAEIEIGLPGIVLRKCSSANMIDRTLRNAHDAPSPCPQPPAEVYFLVVGKEPAIESTV